MPDPSLTPPKPILKRTDDFEPNSPAPYVELGLISAFSFLRGASQARQIIETAFDLGYHALGIADCNTMAGVVQHHANAKVAKIRPVIGCRLELVEGYAFLAYPKDRTAYGRLCTLLSQGKMQTLDGAWQDKGECHLTLEMLAEHSEGVQLIALPGEDVAAFSRKLPSLANQLASLRYIGAAYLYRGDDRARVMQLDRLARTNGLSILATNDVHYHAPNRRPLQDIMTCIREKTTMAQAGYLLDANAERHLKSPQEMQRLFADWPHAIAATREVADACGFSLNELRYEYPELSVPEDLTPDDYLAKLTWAGAQERYPEGTPLPIVKTLKKELTLIAKMQFAPYFLTINDIVQHARSQDILCQGRGSAANSAVCYCLKITSVDPAQCELLFERFISEERKEPPDIDVDFEHERREEVIQHIYQQYGREHAGLCATVIHYRPRSAIREVGKAMGLSEDVTATIARTIWGSWGSEMDGDRVERETGLDMADPYLKRAVALADQMIGMPRHLSQHVGGFILTKGPLTSTIPIGNGAMPERSFIEWDKDDIEELGILKIDVLALGMLTCIRKCFALIKAHCGETHTLASVEQEDAAVYRMLQKGDSLGVFQVESRAQMNMLPRLKPATFYDLVIQVAIVRPGPIQGDMVHPYLKRRKGKEYAVYPEPSPEYGPPDELRNILKRTLGVPIFQEQAMKIAMVAARFSPPEANQLRKAMATFRSRHLVSEHKDKMVGRMVKRGYDAEFAARCFSQIEGFGEYGFPESHAASFAHLVYVSSWIKHYYPAIFAAGLLNSQPMGFYAPAQIVRDAREHGVTVLAADVNYSQWDNTVEWQMVNGGKQLVLRLGFRQIEGFGEKDANRLLKARSTPYVDVENLRERARLHTRPINQLAAADAFRSTGKDRRAALWDARALKQAPDLPLFTFGEHRDEGQEQPVLLPTMPECEHVVADYQTMRLSLRAHPCAFLRQSYEQNGFIPAASLRDQRFNARVKVAGIVLIRQKPGSAKGVCFITLEDEGGVINLVIWPDVMERYRKVVMGARLMEVHGKMQKDDDVIHVVAERLFDATPKLLALSDNLLETSVARADHVISPLPSGLNSHPRDAKIIPSSRDFH